MIIVFHRRWAVCTRMMASLWLWPVALSILKSWYVWCTLYMEWLLLLTISWIPLSNRATIILKSINFGYCPNLKPIVLVVYHLATLQQGRPMEFTAGAPVSNNHRCCLMTFICFRVCTIFWQVRMCALPSTVASRSWMVFNSQVYHLFCNVKETKVSKYLQYVFGTKAWILLSGGFKIPQMRWSKLSRIGPF